MKIGILGGIMHYFRTPLHEECPKYHGHKGEPRMTPGTSGAIGERAQAIPVWSWLRALKTPSIHEN